MLKTGAIIKKGVLLILAASITFACPQAAKAYVDVTSAGEDGKNQYLNTDTNDACIGGLSGGHTVYAYINSFVKAKTVTKNVYDTTNEIKLYTTYDVARFGNFRTSKKALKAKVVRLIEDNYSDIDYYVTGVDGKKYCKNIFGQKRQYNDSIEAEAKKTNKYHAYGEYNITFFSKKTGTYKFYYDALDQDGKVITTKTVKVIVKDDGDPFKGVFFDGKRLYTSHNEMLNGKENNIYSSSKDGTYTTKKSGKLKIVMNKGYKLVKLDIGYKPMGYRDNSTENKWTYTLQDWVWTGVKNGQKIVLNTTDEGTSSYESDDITRAPNSRRIITSKRHYQLATTTIRATYYDKKNKTTERKYFEIDKLINK